MDSATVLGDMSRSNSEISGNRRDDRRYALRLAVKWKLIRRRRVLDSGIGQTIDLSSGGILFHAGREMPEGLNIELSITWPVMLHQVAPLQLVAAGRIVRATAADVAIVMTTHEFRTSGAPAAEQRGDEAKPNLLRFQAK